MALPVVAVLGMVVTGHAAAQVGVGPACRFLPPGPDATVRAVASALALAPPARYLRIIDRPEAHELTIEVGPVHIPARAMDPQRRDLTYQLGYVPVSGWIHGFRIELVDAAGNVVPRRLLHHIVIARPTTRELFLPVTQRFFGLGQETRGLRLPAWLAGAALREGEPVLVNTMFHNPTDSSYEGVRLRLVLDYRRTRPLYVVVPFNLDVMFPLGPKEFDLPPGRSERTWEGSPAMSSTAMLPSLTVTNSFLSSPSLKVSLGRFGRTRFRPSTSGAHAGQPTPASAWSRLCRGQASVPS